MKKLLIIIIILMAAFISCFNDLNELYDKGASPYKVGDYGPAGGRIFYDKGTFSDGWRYLEVWPVYMKDTYGDLDDDLVYGPANSLENTSTAIGKGKSNTDLIRNKTISSYPAFRACIEHRGGGYDDWFLPSKDELTSLCQIKSSIGLAGETHGFWSSSETDKDFASVILFGACNSQTTGKAGSYYVYPVRKF